MAEIYRIGSDDLIDRVSQFGGTNLLRMTAEPTVNTNTPPTYGNTSGGNGTVSIVTVSDSPIPNITKAFQIANNTSGNKDFSQIIDSFKNLANTGTWIFSFYVKSLQASSTLLIRMWDYTAGKQRFGYSSTITNTIWSKMSIKITASGAIVNNNNALNFGCTGSSAIQYIAPKLELGTKPTDWTPAPQDLVTVSGEQLVFFQ